MDRVIPPLQAAAGGALVVVGVMMVTWYVMATAPGVAGSDALKAVGTVTARSELPSGWKAGKFLDSTLIYSETFRFIDQFGIEHTATDQVSAVFYGSHPIGSTMEVLYYADAPSKAVIDNPSRLIPQADAILGAMGVGAMGLGGALALAGITRPRPIKRRQAA
jgi:hypothetical protein